MDDVLLLGPPAADRDPNRDGLFGGSERRVGELRPLASCAQRCNRALPPRELRVGGRWNEV